MFSAADLVLLTATYTVLAGGGLPPKALKRACEKHTGGCTTGVTNSPGSVWHAAKAAGKLQQCEQTFVWSLPTPHGAAASASAAGGSGPGPVRNRPVHVSKPRVCCMDRCGFASPSVLPVRIPGIAANLLLPLCTMHQPRLVGALTNPDLEVSIEGAKCAKHGAGCFVANVVIALAGEKSTVDEECVGVGECVMESHPERMGNLMDVLKQLQRVVVVSVRDENRCEGCDAPGVALADCADCAEEHNDAIADGTIVCNFCDAMCDGQRCSEHPLWLVKICVGCANDPDGDYNGTGCRCCE